jgi:hypothetical protein
MQSGVYCGAAGRPPLNNLQSNELFIFNRTDIDFARGKIKKWEQVIFQAIDGSKKTPR